MNRCFGRGPSTADKGCHTLLAGTVRWCIVAPATTLTGRVMLPVEPLSPELLYRPCDPAGLRFETTDDLDDLVGTIGQDRALEALRVGLGLRREGYNIFVTGASGVGKHTVVHDILVDLAKTDPKPPDLCYVHNFELEHRPALITLPAGRGAHFKGHMKRLIDELSTLLPATFAGDAYGGRVHQIEGEVEKLQEQAFEALDTIARQQDLTFVRTPDGFTFAPLKDGSVLEQEEYDALPIEARKVFEASLSEMEGKLKIVMSSVPRWRKDARDRLQALQQEVTGDEVEKLLLPLREAYSDAESVLTYLAAVKADIIEHVRLFMESDDDDDAARQKQPASPVTLRRYEVNVLVDNQKSDGAPVIFEDSPGLAGLVGRIEHNAVFGTMVTDHTMIKAGAFQRASGGYLILDARKLLTEQFAWNELKRILRSRRVRMDSPLHRATLMTAVTLEPEAVPVDVKVILLGEPLLYYELQAADPEFERHFKIVAAFEEQVERTPEHIHMFARLIATKARKKGIKPLAREAIAAIIEHSSREIEDSEHIWGNLSYLFNLMDEADFWAEEAGHKVVGVEDVNAALSARGARHRGPQERMHKAIARGTIMVDTDGAVIGQINGLAVLSLGKIAFGRPSRISATARMGTGQVVDIEREAHLAGNIHRKGMLILEALLGSRYVHEKPLSLAASLVFEQSYGMVDGDSASLAELVALLSAIGRVPILQSRAVTGSINSNGLVQAIGGVNAKIEGFFDLCNERGLTGTQGVLIPSANVKNLMLKPAVVKAVANKKFSVWAVSTVEQAMTLLSGVTAGVRDENGVYELGSFNRKVEDRLIQFYEQRRRYAASFRDLSPGS